MVQSAAAVVGLDIFDVGSIAEDGEPPDDPWHLRDWMLVRDIRRRLVAGT